ncbi:RRN11 [Candida pseudojiufengensis]|uniref:RRN11 n=1 Tax=Candida pseudojiufengensis TaxID=497109 RepID=UPI002225A80E|nr:RRN11 [Candida pseudojiufengensis]KAI5962358.1 RRN11 [Candida pseudojiufengensis]
MIFEDITDNYKKYRRSKQNQTQIISKYVELKKYNQIYETLNKVQKCKISSPKVKSKVLRIIHKELDKKLKPEETFEIWHYDLNKQNDDRKMKTKRKKSKKNEKKNKNEDNNNGLETNVSDSSRPDVDPLTLTIQEYLNTKVANPNLNAEDQENQILNGDIPGVESESDEDEYSNDKYIEYDIRSTHEIENLTNAFDTKNTITKTKFIIESSGMEILPNQEIFKESITNKHLNNLNTLLHFNMLRKNWDVAYNIFCLIIRFPMVDVRLIWPLGIEILTELSKNLSNKASSTYELKITKFFNYLNSFYLVNYRNQIALEISDRTSLAPTWRVGTKTLTPLYLLTSLWYLFVAKKAYVQILNRVSELILEPPYHDEGALYFISILCCLNLMVSSINMYDLQINDREKFHAMENSEFRTFNECEATLDNYKEMIDKNVEMCLKLNFCIPEDEIEEQCSHIRETLVGIEATKQSTPKRTSSSSSLFDEEEDKTIVDNFDPTLDGDIDEPAVDGDVHYNKILGNEEFGDEFEFEIDDKNIYDDSNTRLINEGENEKDIEDDYDDWGDIESDKEEELNGSQVIDTSTQQNLVIDHKQEDDSEFEGVEDDWSRIKSDANSDDEAPPRPVQKIENSLPNGADDVDFEVDLKNGLLHETNKPSHKYEEEKNNVSDEDEWAEIESDLDETSEVSNPPAKLVNDTQQETKDNYINESTSKEESVMSSAITTAIDESDGKMDEFDGWSEIESDDIDD